MQSNKQFSIWDSAIINIKEKYMKQISKLQDEINSLQQSCKDNDSGQDVIETRNEINMLEGEIRLLKKACDEEIKEYEKYLQPQNKSRQ